MRALVTRALEAAIAAVDAERVTAEALHARPIHGRVHLIALGKAALGMCAGAIRSCDVVGGLAIAPRDGREVALPSSMRVLYGDHPVPDAGVARRGEALLEAAAAIPAADTALVLVSGGGSALVDAPIEGVDPAALAALTQRLLACGASIDELNAIRVSLSRSKGGGLGRALRTARARVLVISDVVGDRDGARVASGPMSAWRGLAPQEVAQRPHIAAALGELAPLVARGVVDPAPHFALEVIADNARAVAAARACLEESGLHVGDGPSLTGEARRAGAAWASAAASTTSDALVGGGETVVTVRGRGRGGRSQEMALAALDAGITGTLLCAGTDGIDGPTDAAGAIVDARTRELVTREAIQRALRDNDAYTVLDDAGALLRIGPTGTNVADLAIWTR